ncbi:PP2C family protein-serine/threonine phosphatase [Bifidobacterium animalis]|uniref:PP2C family protein-serine/threonine phosphatase n=1 Tax=Bifidobacterium animalis TaxID=28025 RepID=UPI00069C53D3|nr:PP2C family serine/threonine-protein phosphatase [Bifidobacterium animalis]MCR1995201.1 protein phosphatase 2C domain-containing protein [Bifidobacterium animalis subsp. animalis]HJD88675.1 protein phosphatase 2C domain-containing protein [Bifidobacterium animalis]
MYSTTVSDVGTVRSNNQDSSFAGEHLVAVCDGMGGHAGGDTASTIAIRSLAHIETDSAGGDVAKAAAIIEASTLAAHDAIVGKAKRERKLAGMGTTVTAITLVSDYWVIAHIGDSRAYLLRDGKLMRLTTDHSYVQHLIDTKRINEVEARNHPQRNVVMRVLGDFDIDAHPDISIRRAEAGDRLLLCSDGLCGVLEDSTIEETLSHFTDPEECAQTLVSMALKAGSTDNASAVIADSTIALDADSFDLPHQTPLIGGAASATLEPIADIIHEPVASAPALIARSSPAERAAALIASDSNKAAQSEEHDATQQVAQPSTVREENGELQDPDTGEIPVIRKSDGRYSADPNDPEVARAIHHEHLQEKKQARSRRFRGKIVGSVVAVAVVAVLALGTWAAYAWSQTQYYLASDNGVVTVYQGVPTNIFGYELSHAIEHTDLKVDELPEQWQDRLRQSISVDGYDEALSHVELIRTQFNDLKKEQEQKAKEDADAKAKQQKQANDSKSPTKSPSPSKSAQSR